MQLKPQLRTPLSHRRPNPIMKVQTVVMKRLTFWALAVAAAGSPQR